jgi:large subunit ribosomal protein L13
VNPLTTYKTISANNATVTKNWHVVDAAGQPLGRLASQIARIIRGKHKPYFTPHVDCGDHVIIINAAGVKLTGMKMEQKEYIRHTGYPGGQRTTLAKSLRPERIIESAVRGMLPKNRLGRKIFHNMFVYAGSEHPHAAQQPKELKFDI